MSETPDIDRVQRLLDGNALLPEDQEWLSHLVDDPEQLANLRRHLDIHSLLSIACEDAHTHERNNRASMAKILAADDDHFFNLVQHKLLRFKRQRRQRLSALAASLVLAAGTVLMLKPSSTPAATLTREESAQWDATSPARVGKTFTIGSNLKLVAGLIELQFGGNGTMIVEGPAELTIVNSRKAELRAGRLVMRVSDAGHGFRVETPSGSIIDKGTEFGVAVSANGNVETSVIEGQIEAKPLGSKKVLLQSNESLHLNNGSLRQDAGISFYTSMPPRHSGIPDFIHWNLNDANQTAMQAHSRGFPHPESLILNKRNGASSSVASLPRATTGVLGLGLSFDGKGSYSECDFRGIGGTDPRTVCFWVRVPSQFDVNEGYAMISWGHFLNNSHGSVWQISANPEAKDGPLGCLRVGTHGGQVIGSTDLRDDQWHHVAVVMYPGSHPNVGKHVFLYIDGRLDPVSQRSLREINTEVATASHGILIGRNVSQDHPSPTGFFRGEIDEVFVIAAALSQSEVQHVMSQNQLINIEGKEQP